MRTLSIFLTRSIVPLLLLFTANALFSQGITSSAIDGIVTDASGTSIAGASVTITHESTSTSYQTVTRNNGYYSVTGLEVGGPYTVQVVTPAGNKVKMENIFVELSRSKAVYITIDKEEIIELEEFTVVDGSNIENVLIHTKTGAGSSIDADSIEDSPALRRSFNDFARFNPYVSINDEDRNELTVAGQNNSFNSIQIDGVKTNDQFGLNSSGQPSLNNPISIDALEAINVEVSPYDVRQSGFTGASINAVTKQGTNNFHGSVYTYYTDDNMRGDSVLNRTNPLFREWTYGTNFSGPIVKDKLFFFVNYEEFKETQVAGGAGFDPDPAAVQQVIDYATNVLGIDPGTFGGSSALKETDEKYLIKLNWNINKKHRMSGRYRKTTGMNPVLADYDDYGQTSLTSNFYNMDVSEEDYAFQLFSTWSSDFQTEFRFTNLKYSSVRSTLNRLPHIVIDDFPTVGGGGGNELFLGTERFSHANALAWDTTQATGVATWYKDDITLTFGFDYEQTDFANTFLESSMGNFGFDSLDDFLNDIPGRNEFGQTPFRYTGIDGQDPVARPDVGVLGFFVQGQWNPNAKLALTGGIRIDTVLQDTVAPEAQGFEDAFGFKNNGTIDGETLIAPRISFNYSFDNDRTIQLRGGVGLFLGRSPAVWLGNVLTNNGETSGNISIDTNLQDYLSGSFDPENPIIYIPREDSRPVVDALENGLELPSVWRANLAVDYKLPWQGLILTVEGLLTETNQGLWVENANQLAVGTGPDGRTIYNGRISNDFQDVYVLRNTSMGKARNFTVSVEKPGSGEGWYGSFAYTYGSSEDVNPFTSSRAVSNWRNRAVVDPNAEELGTSNYEVKNRFLGKVGYTFKYGKGHSTNVTLIYEGREGRPYSVTFSSDMNGDYRSNNDLLYIPDGPADPTVVYAAGFDTDAFFAYLKQNKLTQYRGSVVPRSSQHNPWVHTFDLKITQQIAVWEGITTELFVDFRNIGNWIKKEWGLVDEIGFPFNQRTVRGSYDAVEDVYNYDSFSPDSISTRVGNVRSRYSIQVGAKVKW